ncbi:phage major capsid protein [Cellulosimicrobium sp. RS]|uniref:phage major capsid protein n=1 Tax=Cellulosimicrobium sp. RS TaxID=3381347 RepID=UPI0038FCA643
MPTTRTLRDDQQRIATYAGELQRSVHAPSTRPDLDAARTHLDADPDQVRRLLAEGLTAVQLRQRRAAHLDDMRAATRNAETHNRNLSSGERVTYDAAEQAFRDLTEAIAQTEAAEHREAANARPLVGAGLPGGNVDEHGRTHRDDRRVRRLRSSDSLAEHWGLTRRGRDLSFDRIVRGMTGRGWNGADAEHRAISGLTDSAGGILVPEEVSARIIDLARAASVVTQVGAATVPMDARKVTVPRLESDMTVQWLPELAEQSDSATSFGAMVLEAKTIRALALISDELLEDAEPDEFIAQAAAAAIAAEIDRAAILGTGADEQPRGLYNTPGVQKITTDAAAPTWADLVRSQAAVRARNYEPNAFLYSPITDADLNLQTGNDGQFLQPPSSLERGRNGSPITRAVSSSVPVDLGDTDDEGLIFTGAWQHLVIGWRSQINVKVAEDYGIDRNATALLIRARVDVGVERAGAFHIRHVKTGTTASAEPTEFAQTMGTVESKTTAS